METESNRPAISDTSPEVSPVTSHIVDAVVTITLDTPANRNALSAPLVTALMAALEAIGADPAVRTVVLTGTGTVFCSGADLKERLEARSAPASLAPLLTALATCPKPTIARVNGHVRAGGMGLVAACDLAVAPRTATFSFSEAKVGVVPAVIAVPALRAMGRRGFAAHALTADVFDAPTARDVGLLSAVVDNHADLDPWIEVTSSAIAQCAPSAVAATKQLIDAVESKSWTEAMVDAEARSGQAFGSADAAEGMAAFLEKRPPAWVADRTAT